MTSTIIICGFFIVMMGIISEIRIDKRDKKMKRVALAGNAVLKAYKELAEEHEILIEILEDNFEEDEIDKMYIAKRKNKEEN